MSIKNIKLLEIKIKKKEKPSLIKIFNSNIINTSFSGQQTVRTILS
jgi:hypothetical protein